MPAKKPSRSIPVRVPADQPTSTPSQASPPPLRILKQAQCPTISGKSNLSLPPMPGQTLVMLVACLTRAAFPLRFSI
jgi:hypothetical protein